MKAEYIAHYLDDDAVAHAARLSFSRNASDFSKESNNGLIRYLARGIPSNEYEKHIEALCSFDFTEEEAKNFYSNIRNTPIHWAPFAHPHITLEMSAPVPIRTQCFKHKIGTVESEESRRYIKCVPRVYIPEYFRAAADNVKQGSADGPHERSDYWVSQYTHAVDFAVVKYNEMIADGICPEMARFILPQGTIVRWIWTGSLYAMANFAIQRTDSHAQKEVRDLANSVCDIIAPLYPVSWAALCEGLPCSR